MTTTPNPGDIAIADFTYDLPLHRIAVFPMANRGDAKLLVYEKGHITRHHYHQLAKLIPENHLLVFNKTKVVEARLLFAKPTGASIEIFCLEPTAVYPDITTAMGQTGFVKWRCLVGGAAKWAPGLILEKSITLNTVQITLKAAIETRNADSFNIHFEWSPIHFSFSEILHEFGVIPIPPYLNRPTNAADAERYQTIYAQEVGSVAAPTAGLHFTDLLFEDLRNKQVGTAFVTLHVGAGTFKPVKTERIADHEMHAEFIEVERSTILTLLAANHQIIAVGTTSLRTLESLYWMGVKAALYPHYKLHELEIRQWEVYDSLLAHALTVEQSLLVLLERMETQSLTRILCKTQIIIAPGYPFKMVKGLITNFHQPQSTLLLLVAALIGPEWRKLYQYALDNDFRFLSYGDGSLLWHNQA